MSNLLARSPYIVRINQSGQTTTKIELFFHTGSVPASPQYTSSKVIPTPTNPSCEYNISPFARNHISHVTVDAQYDTMVNTPTSEYTQVRVKKYANGVNYATDNHYFFDGYGTFEQGANPLAFKPRLASGRYYYWYDENNTPASVPQQRAGNLTIQTTTGDYLVYTNLKTGATTNVSLTNNSVVDIHRVKGSNYADGNKVELFTSLNILQATWIFEPIHECRYTPVRVDFVNKYGAWQREWFFKSNVNSIETTGTTFNLMAQDTNYNTAVGQRQEFNLDGQETIKLNTGFVDEFYGSVMQEILLSERILLNDLPVVRKSTGVTKLKHVDQKLINYTMEFTYAFDVLNSIQ